VNYPDHLLKLMAVLRKLPGVGSKTAERFAFHLLNWPEGKLQEMGLILQDVKKNLAFCEECGALIEKNRCIFCNCNKRDSKILCIIATPRDLFLVEETREYKGLYHVLGALLSPIHDHGFSTLALEKLKNRIERLSIKEVIIALDSTLEGDATALFLKRELQPLSISVSRLAFGLPMGSSLDLIDGGTLARALSGRRIL